MFMWKLAQFRERYKDHQVALQHLAPVASAGFLNKLRNAGSRIYARRDQAKELQAIKSLVIFTDDKSSIASSSESDPDTPKLAEEADIDTEVEAETDEKVKINSDDLQLLAGKFVRLSDLIPPLPSKGNLKVEDIKASPYFFS
jgi:DNA-directed RNA polymerase